MKTAEEWAISQWQPCPENVEGRCVCVSSGTSCKRLTDLIRAAQRDAIEAAAKMAINEARVIGALPFSSTDNTLRCAAESIRSLLPTE